MLSRFYQGIILILKFSIKNFYYLIFALFLFSALNTSANSFSNEEPVKTEDVCPIVLFIEPLATICLEPTLAAFPLMVTIQGSDGSGFGVWSGPGIIDPILGIFDPLDPSTSIGENIVTFTFTENGCVIDEQTVLNLRPPPDAGFSIDTPICQDDVSNVLAIKTDAQIYSWDFDGGVINFRNRRRPLRNYVVFFRRI